MYAPDHDQDNCNGYHILKYKDEVVFSGMLRQGLPDSQGSLKWADGSEYHGEFVDGELTGYGRYIFVDQAEFRGSFVNGLPREGFYLPPHNDVRRIADYSERMPDTPLWDIEPENLLHPKMVDLPLPQFTWGKADCMAVANVIKTSRKGSERGKTPKNPVVHDFTHMKKVVTARLVWARPLYADQPLWNANEVRGKIVAVSRGPRAPANACSYSVKLFHCQNAGAVGVVIVDFDPEGAFKYVLFVMYLQCPCT